FQYSEARSCEPNSDSTSFGTFTSNRMSQAGTSSLPCVSLRALYELTFAVAFSRENIGRAPGGLLVHERVGVAALRVRAIPAEAGDGSIEPDEHGSRVVHARHLPALAVGMRAVAVRVHGHVDDSIAGGERHAAASLGSSPSSSSGSSSVSSTFAPAPTIMSISRSCDATRALNRSRV